ncbi:MAG: hypothetical protein ABJB97_09690 [Acidobacteriota bacterium]
MSNLTPQTVSLLLSLLGIVILLACLILIGTKRVPELRSNQTIRALGIDLNISLITLLVLVGLVLALTSTYLQVRNYDEKLLAADRKGASLEAALSRAGKMNVNAVVNLEGVSNPDDMPSLEDVYCRYYVKGPDREGWVERAKVTPGIYTMDLVLTIEDISPASSIERIEIKDRNPQHTRTWTLDHVGSVLSPKFLMKKT